MATGRIIGTGSYLPETVVTNDFLAGILDTSDEWIRTRTGIRERRLVKEETTTLMCVEAARRALENARVDPKEIDLIIVGTVTADYITPSAACFVQGEIGADRAVAFDINAACAGFMVALNTVQAYICAGIYRTALIIGAETLSRIMDWEDRTTCVLFGDGAGAAVVRAEERGFLAFDQGSDGSRAGVLSCKGRGNSNPLIQEREDKKEYVHMDGQEVYKFAVRAVPQSILKVLDEAELTPGDVDYYILHQANLRIIQSVAKRLEQEEEKFPISLDYCGNISAGSIPILLDAMNRDGRLQRGRKLLLSGFGAGLIWGSVLLEW